MSCPVQGLKNHYQMKTLVKISAAQNNTSFANFSNVQLNNAQLKMIKGGDGDSSDVIIIEDMIQG